MQTHSTRRVDQLDETNLKSSFNIAPKARSKVVRLSSETDVRELTVMRWDLVL